MQFSVYVYTLLFVFDFNMIFVVWERASCALVFDSSNSKIDASFSFLVAVVGSNFWFLALSCDFAMGTEFFARTQYFKTYVLAVERNRFSFRHIRSVFSSTFPRFYYVRVVRCGMRLECVCACVCMGKWQSSACCTTVGVLNNFMKIYYLRKKINNEL